MMDNKQKLGYILLGAGIMALGITIGQFITPDIEAQSSGVFDKVVCRALEVVDKDGNKGISLGAHGMNTVTIFNKPGKPGMVLFCSESNGNNIFVFDGFGQQLGPAITLESRESVNKVIVSDKQRNDAFRFESDKTNNWFSIQDKEHPEQAAFWIYSSDSGNYSSRWIRGRGRVVEW